MVRIPYKSRRAGSSPSSGASQGSPPGAAAAVSGALTVTQAAALIHTALAQALPERLRIVGEISNFSNRTHWFFSLKDQGACLRCVCFASTAKKTGFVPTDGMQVVLTGRVDFYDAQGSLQIYVDKIEPVGQGTLEMQFRALCQELRQLGYFDESRKKPLPLLPLQVAVVTSRTGAALQDVLNTAGKRWPGCRLLLLDVHVQGAAAAPQIAQAIDQLSRFGPDLGIDAILLTRGGGSIEDLWAFNERVVADALFRCRLPVVAAIGHESDTTVAELVADVRCSTPTQAVMSLIPDHRALRRQIQQMQAHMNLSLRKCLAMAQQRLQSSARHPFFKQPQRILDPLRQRLSLYGRQMDTAVRHRLESQHDRLTALGRQLDALGPTNVLARGFSYTLGSDGHVLRTVAQVQTGDPVTTVLSDGRFQSRVMQCVESAPPEPPEPPESPEASDTTQPPVPSAPKLLAVQSNPPRRSRKTRVSADVRQQMDLFVSDSPGASQS